MPRFVALAIMLSCIFCMSASADSITWNFSGAITSVESPYFTDIAVGAKYHGSVGINWTGTPELENGHYDYDQDFEINYSLEFADELVLTGSGLYINIFGEFPGTSFPDMWACAGSFSGRPTHSSGIYGDINITQDLWILTYEPTYGQFHINGTVDSVIAAQPSPEPATILLTFLGLVGVVGLIKKINLRVSSQPAV